MRTATKLAVASALALLCGVSAVGAASAAPPTWHYCAKSKPEKTGGYSDNKCATPSAPGQGTYELLAGVGKAKPFKGISRQVTIHVVLPSGGEIRVECQTGKISGRMVAPSSVAGVRLTLKQCRVPGAPCLSGNGNRETIESDPLTGELGWLNRESGQSGLLLESEDPSGISEPGAGEVVAFRCTGVAKYRVSGAFIGAIAPIGKVSKDFALGYDVGDYFGEPAPGYQPLTNPPAFEERSVGVLETEMTDPEGGGEWSPEGGLPSGIDVEGTFAIKGEALEIG
jgi:hypothetical protein